MADKKDKKSTNKNTGGKVSGKDSIRTKLILIMTMLVAIPLALTIVISTLNTVKQGEKNIVTTNDIQVGSVERDLADVLDTNMTAIQTVAASPSTIDYIEDPTDEELYAGVLAQIQQVDANIGDGNAIAISGADGMQIVKSKGDPVDVSEREYFQKAMAGTPYVSDMTVSKSNGSLIATFSCPVYNADGSAVIGIVQRNYNLTVFQEMAEGEVIEDQQEIIIVDRTGMAIAHSGTEITAEATEDDSSMQFYTDAQGDAASGSFRVKADGKTWFISWIKEPKTGWVIASCRVQAVTMASTMKTAILLILLGLGCLVVAIIVAFVIAKSVTEPIFAINESLDKLSNGRFSKIEKFHNRKDEFGAMVTATNSLIDRLSGIVANIKQSASSVNTSSEALAETTDQISQTADDVSNAVQDIASGATQQAEEIQNATTNTNQISDNIQNVTNNSTTLEESANSMNAESKESAAQLDKLKVSSEEMGHAVDEIYERIGATSKAVESINSKVDAISSIASQTNLLALNASIEAARAGEAGRGFAVVAEEIGQLADDSAKSASEIKEQMDVLLQESQGAVKKAEEVRKATEEQRAILDSSVQSIDGLINQIGETMQGIQSITQSADACNDSKLVVVDAMDSLSAISEENAASTEETSASMQELSATVATLSTAADNLKEVSNNLMQQVEFFKED
ncbi:MAG: methyl-accepting chemotaxis protein [Lachnospiraceae bacterium]|nr:methyl-accepting chemotaxis protein [Lachnospiraceae bacterium]